MTIRLLILVAVAGGLAVMVAVKVSNPAPAQQQIDDIDDTSDGLTPEERERINRLNKELNKFDLPGEEPEVEPEFDVQIEVDLSSGKNRLVSYINETHGYYVETLAILYWYKEKPDMVAEDSPLTFEQHFDLYIPANETLKLCIEVVPAELSHVGGDIGESEKWGAEVIYYNRAREQNPEILHERSARRCD
ncbi:MAG: hypothetical protein ACYTHJ_14385 [Planctomycetota bacterium]|jgi:hypothetical protein